MKVVPMEVTLIDHCGSDLSVVNAARVSFNKESSYVEERIPGLGIFDRLKDSDEKLINYLAKHKHLSPFNHSFISLRVKAPIFVARQLVKHEYMPWNEVSRRYVKTEPEFFIPDALRQSADNVKQGSLEDVVKYNNLCIKMLEATTKHSLTVYEYMLAKGVCPEQARMVLPQNLMTEWIWSGTLGAFSKMLGLRLDEHTQKETRDVAIMIRDIVEPLFPVSLNALLGNFK